MSDRLRCRHCGDVIGVYEPMITFVEGCARESSRLAEPLAGALDGRCYHRSCYETLAAEPDGEK
jgi:hypothetical protein